MALKLLNPLPIDRDIIYDDVSHSYGLHSAPFKQFTSVTTVAAKRMPPFNATVISAKLAAAGKGKYAGKTAEEIRTDWKTLASLGTALHAAIELYYNGGPPPNHRGFLKVAKHFRDERCLIPWRTELQMASKATGIAGTADMLFLKQGCQGAAGGVVLVDWKRTDSIEEVSRYDKCLRELAHLPGTKFWKFALQLNLYAQLLWETCGVPVAEMLLVMLHPDGESFKILTVPVLPEAASIYRRPR